MELITFIPFIIGLVVLLKGKTQNVLLYVFLPTLLLIPTDYTLRLPSVPPVNLLVCSMLPLLIGMLLYDIRRWKVTRMDFLVLLFFFSHVYTEFATEHTVEGVFTSFAMITTGLIPYMAGKLLIEQNEIRVTFLTRYVSLLFIGCPLAWYEYFRKANFYQYFWSHFYPGQWSGWITLIRWGFGRVAGPFSQSELAGMVYLTGLFFVIWLRHEKYKGLPRTSGLQSSPLKHSKLVLLVIGFTLLTTQARGPWLGTIFASSIAWIGLSRVPKRRAIYIFLFWTLIALPGYYFVRDYSAGPRTDFGSEKETAQYRAQLIDNYLPVAQAGGAWGWGPYGYPHMGGQVSIDNEYLIVYLAQGYIGLTVFLIIIADTSYVLIKQGLRSKSIRDRHFIFTLLAVFMGLSLTITTVFLGAQNFEIFFLIIGWAQSIKAIINPEMLPHQEDQHAMRHQTLGMRVYT